jgi:hypothetical protein
MEKKCYKCGITKDMLSFSKDKYKKDGVCIECKECRKVFYNKNQDRFKEWNAGHYKNNPELHKGKKERLKETNPDYFKEHYKKNKEKKQAYKKVYNKENRDKLNERFKRRYYSEPQFRISQTYRNRVRDAIKKAYKSGHTLELLGCTIPELKSYLEARFLPTMTWENYGTLWHIDHIIPCAFYNLVDPEQQKICFHYINLQPLFAKTTIIEGVTYIGNLEKSDSILQ